MKYIDLETWPRKEHFEFFSRFEEPFYGVSVDIDCTRLYQKAKADGVSFYLLYLHCIIAAVNETESFRYRIDSEGRIMVYDIIHVGPTIPRPDNTFGYGRFSYFTDFASFAENATEQTRKIQLVKGLGDLDQGSNIIHFSALPWIKFTSVSHARAFSFQDSVPKISVGKITEVHGRRMMPVSIHVHHGLVDGYHLGQFIDKLQELFNKA